MLNVMPIDAILVALLVIATVAITLVGVTRFAAKNRKSPAGKFALIGLILLLAIFVFFAIKDIRKTKEERILQGAVDSTVPVACTPGANHCRAFEAKSDGWIISRTDAAKRMLGDHTSDLAMRASIHPPSENDYQRFAAYTSGANK